MEKHNVGKNNTLFDIKKAEKQRKDCYLPIMYFPVADPYAESNWIDTLGEKSFCGWLKLYTLADRREKENPEYSKVPIPMTELAKIFKVTKPTLYNTIIKPLWNYGLIDLVEFDAGRKGQKAINVIVYSYPQNNADLEKLPLEKIRDYNTDYQSVARTNAKLGGRVSESEVVIKPMGKKNLTVRKYKLSRKNVGNIQGKKNLTPPVKKIKPNNIQSNINKQKDKEIKRLSPGFAIQDVDLENAKKLFELTQENFPNAQKPNFQNWADEFRLLRTQLKQPDNTIKYLIDWSQNHYFWRKNIRSAATFRKQYDRLFLEAQDDAAKKQGYASYMQKVETEEYTARLMQEAEENKNKPKEVKEETFDQKVSRAAQDALAEFERKVKNGEI